MTIAKTGRPRNGEQRELLVPVTFKADAETLEALARLVLAAGRAARFVPHTIRSAIIRQAILDAAQRTSKPSSK